MISYYNSFWLQQCRRKWAIKASWSFHSSPVLLFYYRIGAKSTATTLQIHLVDLSTLAFWLQCCESISVLLGEFLNRLQSHFEIAVVLVHRWTWYIVVHSGSINFVLRWFIFGCFSSKVSVLGCLILSCVSSKVIMKNLRSFTSISDALKNWTSVSESKSPFSGDIEGYSEGEGDCCNCARGDDICVMNKGCLQGKTRMMIDMNIIGPLIFCPTLVYLSRYV